MRNRLLSLLFVAALSLPTLPGCIWIVTPPDNTAPTIDFAVAELIYDGSSWSYVIDVSATDLDLDLLDLSVSVSQPANSNAVVTWTFENANSWGQSLPLGSDFLPQWDTEFLFVVSDGYGGVASTTQSLATTVTSPWVNDALWGCGIDSANISYFFTEAAFDTPQAPLFDVTALFTDPVTGADELFVLSPDPSDDLIWFFESDAVDTAMVLCSGTYDVEIMAQDDRGVTSYTLFEGLSAL